MTMNSLAESLLGPPDPAKAAFLDFGLGPPTSPHQHQQTSQHPPGLAPPYPLQALPPQQQHQQHSHDGGSPFPPSYGRPLAYPTSSYPGAAAGSPHTFYHHHHHGAPYSPYQQTPNPLSHGTRLEETGKAGWLAGGRRGEVGTLTPSPHR